MRGLHPGNDSGTTALIDEHYDDLMSVIVGEPLESMVVLAVTTDDGQHGILPYHYRPLNAKTCNWSVSPNPQLRLATLMSAVRGATEKAESNGLECA